MAKAINPEAATSLHGDAVAPQAGAAQPPLDLSLGHFGTREEDGGEDHEIDVARHGHLRLVIDYDRMTVTVLVDSSKMVNRQARRRSERSVQKVLALLRSESFQVQEGGSQ